VGDDAWTTATIYGIGQKAIYKETMCLCFITADQQYQPRDRFSRCTP
jgi:hypothetical protein